MAEWQVAILILLSIVGLFTSVICVKTIYCVCCKRDQIIEDKAAIGLTLICVIFHTLNAVLDPVGFYYYAMTDSNDSLQDILYNAWSTLWTLSKLSLYLVYIYRLYVTFKETPYSYSIGIYLPISFLWMLQCVIMILYISVRNDFDEDSDLALIASTVFIIFDFLIIIVMMILFLVPISKLITSLKSNDQHIMIPNMFNMDYNDTLSVLTVDDKEVSHFTANSMDFAIMSKTYKEAPTTSRIKENKEYKEKEIYSLSDSFRFHGADSNYYKYNNQSDPELLNTMNSSTNIKKDRYGSMEIMTKKDAKWNFNQQRLLAFGTRLLLLAIICLISSFLYQITWIVSIATHHDFENVYWFTYTWNVDMLINIICLYLSFRFTNIKYERICIEACQCHQYCMKCVESLI